MGYFALSTEVSFNRPNIKNSPATAEENWWYYFSHSGHSFKKDGETMIIFLSSALIWDISLELLCAL